MRKIAFILIIVSAIFSQQYRVIPNIVTKVGSAAAPFLKLETGIREIGMSGAQVASNGGISSLPYNPASIGFVEDQEMFFNKTDYLAGISHNVFGYAKKINATDIVGFHMFYLDSGEMDRRDNTGEKTGTFNVYDLAIRASYVKIFTDRLKVGFTFKYFREDIDNMYLHGVAADVGSNFDTGIYGFVLGMSVSNFGPDVRFRGEGLKNSDDPDYQYDTDVFPLPMIFRLGLQNDFIGPSGSLMQNGSHRLSFEIDGIKPIDFVVTGCLGFEYSWKEMAFARLGTHLGHDTAGVSLGFGLNYRGIQFDYALVQYADLGSTGQFGIKLNLDDSNRYGGALITK